MAPAAVCTKLPPVASCLGPWLRTISKPPTRTRFYAVLMERDFVFTKPFSASPPPSSGPCSTCLNQFDLLAPPRDILISQFLGAAPFRVYALASRWNLEEEAKVASRGTLKMDISEEIPKEDVELIGYLSLRQS